jgi:hypothetical protein
MRTTMVMMGLALAGSATAQQRVREAIISDAATNGWAFDNVRPKAVSAPAGVPGGKALQVTIPQKGANAWAMQARLPMKEGIAATDTLTFGFYARAATPDPGKDTATVTVRFQRIAAPYDAALEGPVTIGREWTFVCLTGASRLALTPAELSVSVQLAGDKRVVEFGPYMATRIPAQGEAIRSGLPCGRAVAAAGS